MTAEMVCRLTGEGLTLTGFFGPLRRLRIRRRERVRVRRVMRRRMLRRW